VLITTVTRGYDRVSIHGVRRTLLHAQAAALGLPLVEAWLEPGSSNEAYEAAWAAAVDVADGRHGPMAHIAYGDLFLADVRAYRDAQLARLGRTPVYPIWGLPTADLARHFVDAGYRAVLTCVDTTQLAPDFAGREFDAALLRDLPAAVDPCGERGEFHTCVLGGPLFREPIAATVGDRVRRDGRFEYCDLVPA
jgi:diphthamide synthase (EF-2-diphthine--ammonia ligase)